jgi:hypothetical protein
MRFSQRHERAAGLSELATDPRLLKVARRLLSTRGFRVRERQIKDLDAGWLLGENEYFLLAVAAGETFDDLRVIEGYLAREMHEIFDAANLGSKRWDAYVVLLASSGIAERGHPDVVRLQYNTRSMRRLVCLGVQPNDESVSGALATFLPLPEPPPGGLTPAFDELVQQLVINGIPKERAAKALADYRSVERLHDA